MRLFQSKPSSVSEQRNPFNLIFLSERRTPYSVIPPCERPTPCSLMIRILVSGAVPAGGRQIWYSGFKLVNIERNISINIVLMCYDSVNIVFWYTANLVWLLVKGHPLQRAERKSIPSDMDISSGVKSRGCLRSMRKRRAPHTGPQSPARIWPQKKDALDP